MRLTRRRTLIAFALGLLPVSAWAAVRPIGPELRVNPPDEERQFAPVAAFSASGRSVVVWEDEQLGIYGTFYGSTGNQEGSDVSLVANTGFTGLPFSGEIVSRREPAVVFLPGGDLLLAWTEERALVTSDYFIEHRTIEDQDVMAQRFSAAGAPIGLPARLNAASSGLQHTPRLAARAGGFVAVWEAGPLGVVMARALDGDGQPLAAEVRVSEVTGERAAVAVNKQGSVLVVWDGVAEGHRDVFARSFDANLQPRGAVFRVSGDGANRQARPTVAAAASGDFLVAWQGEHPEVWAGFYFLYAQAVSARGRLAGPQLQLTRGRLDYSNPEIAPALTTTASGRFLLTWMTWRGGNGIDIAGVELTSWGVPVGKAFWITEHRVRATCRHLSLAADKAGNFLLTWESADRENGIAARRLQGH